VGRGLSTHPAPGWTHSAPVKPMGRCAPGQAYLLNGRWEKHLKRLQKYRVAEGDCRVPVAFGADGTKLGLWVKAQRLSYNAGELSQERFKKLDAVDFVWDILAEGWDLRFEELAAFHAAHGHCVVPYDFLANDGTKLRSWVDQQRTAAQAGELTADRRAKLKALGLGALRGVNSMSRREKKVKLEALRFRQAAEAADLADEANVEADSLADGVADDEPDGVADERRHVRPLVVRRPETRPSTRRNFFE